MDPTKELVTLSTSVHFMTASASPFPQSHGQFFLAPQSTSGLARNSKIITHPVSIVYSPKGGFFPFVFWPRET
jgi:hypothetical protein